MFLGRDLDSSRQPLPLPLHVSNLAVGGTTVKVPEPEMYLLLAILSLILLLIFAGNQMSSGPRKIKCPESESVDDAAPVKPAYRENPWDFKR